VVSWRRYTAGVLEPGQKRIAPENLVKWAAGYRAMWINLLFSGLWIDDLSSELAGWSDFVMMLVGMG